jgi:universal stress protein E
MKFKQLLIPVAPEQSLNETFHQALVFADVSCAQVTLLTVVEDLQELREISKLSVTTLNLFENAIEIYRNQLKRHVQDLSPLYQSITFSTEVRVGIPFIEIIKSAKENQSDLIIIDTHRNEKDAACQRGSTTRHLMRKSEVPIWSICESQNPVNRIAVAIDVTCTDMQPFNEKIISLAIEYCLITGAELNICNAWRLDTEGFLRKWNGYNDIDIALVAKQLRDKQSDRINSLLLPYEMSVTCKCVNLIEGDAKKVLPDFFEKDGIDMVILGSLSRTGIAGFLIGNTAESMLDKLNCSVITLKPDEFHSPVFTEETKSGAL